MNPISRASLCLGLSLLCASCFAGTAFAQARAQFAVDVVATCQKPVMKDLPIHVEGTGILRQEVDVDSLLQLSDSDLKDMGLATIGARRKLTAAIHRYKLQKMSEDGVEAGGAAAKPRVSAAGSEYVPKLAPVRRP